MRTRDVFWERVNAALDERRDPLDDPEVQVLVADEPEFVPEFVADLARLRTRLGELSKSRRQRPRRVAGMAAAAIVGLAGVFALWREWSRSTPSTDLAKSFPMAASDLPALGVLAFRAEVVVDGPSGRTINRFDGTRVRTIRETRSPSSTEDGRSALGFAAVIDSTSYSR